MQVRVLDCLLIRLYAPFIFFLYSCAFYGEGFDSGHLEYSEGYPS